MYCIPPLTLASSSPWCRQMFPWSGDVSEDPVAPSEGHWAGYIAATCVTQHSRPWLLSTQSCGGHWGQCLPKEQEAWDAWAGVPPHRSPAPTDKEPACAAWDLWCSPSCPGTSETHLQPPEPLVGWPSEYWTPGSRSHGEEGLHGGQTILQYLVPLCQEQLLDMNPTWHRVLTVVTHLASQLQIRSSANQISPQVTQTKVGGCLQRKATWFWLIKYFKSLPYLFNPRQYS